MGVVMPDDPHKVPAYLSPPHEQCRVPRDYLLSEELKGRMRAAQPPVDTLARLPADGLYSYGEDARRYGIRQAVEALMEVGRIWQLRGNKPHLGVGDISLKGGGDITGHESHEKGVDIDIRPLKSNGEPGPITYQEPLYSHNLTQELIDLLHANGKLAVQLILFNDPNAKGVQHFAGHDNHLHVRHWFPGMQPARPVLSQGSRHLAVREAQRRLNFWIESVDPRPCPTLVIDGDYGGATRTAVLAFQSAAGLAQNGSVDNETWNALPTNRATAPRGVIAWLRRMIGLSSR